MAPTTTEAPVAIETDETTAVDDTAVEDTVIEDVLVEDVSIDGMCGVY